MGKDILTNLLNDFQGIFVGGSTKMQNFANWFIIALAIVDIAIVVLMNMDDADHMKSLVKKVLTYSFFLTLVKFWPVILNGVFEGFNWIGFKAGGADQMVSWIKEPHQIATKGPDFAKPILNHIQDLLPKHFWNVPAAFGRLPEIIIFYIIYLLVIICFFVIGIQIFMTTIEFYIVGVIGMLLLPFGAFEKTGYLAEKALEGTVNFGIKLMTLTFIASASYSILSKYMTKTIGSIDDALYVLLGSFTITLLAFLSPGVVSGILSSSPSLTAGSALMGAAGVGMAARVAGKLNPAVGAAVKGASSVGKAVSGGVQGTAKTAGALREAAKIGANGKSGISAVAGAAKGIAGYAASKSLGALKNMGKANFNAGKSDAQKTLDGGNLKSSKKDN